MKTFAENQSIEFIRDTNYGREWEKGSYVNVGWKEGRSVWHRVLSERGERFLVPSRRIRAVEDVK